MLGDNCSDCPRKCLPFFFLSFVPMILPEIVIWLENRHFLYVHGNVHAQRHQQCMFQDAKTVMSTTQPRWVILDNERFDGPKAVESSFLEFDNFSAVSCASFRKYVQDRVKAFFALLLPMFYSIEDFLFFALVITTVDPKSWENVSDLSEEWYFLNFFLRKISWVD